MFLQAIILTPILARLLYFSNSVKNLFLNICSGPKILKTLYFNSRKKPLLNSALEKILDLTHPKQHEFAAKAKDYGSAAVFLSFCIAALVWFGVLYL